MEALLDLLLPSLGDSLLPQQQLGAARTLRVIICSSLDLRLLPYALILLRPLLSALSANLAETRAEAARAFSALMPLLPLEAGAAEPLHFSGEENFS